MKKLLIAMVALLIGAASFADEDPNRLVKRVYDSDDFMREWTPFSLTLATPVAIPYGDWDIKGAQLGIINYAYRFRGVQIGVFNIAERVHGVQVGLFNIITSDDIPFLPVVNWRF